ncbi:class I SAM-dependent methyltransferase [Stackebrandtia albiflava]|nr:class I SAM-dependent methyltransferase [Stackebrandtia albiflava]
MFTRPAVISVLLVLAAAPVPAHLLAGDTGLLACVVLILLVIAAYVLSAARLGLTEDRRRGAELHRRLDRVDTELRAVRTNVNRRAHELKRRVDPLAGDIRDAARRLDRRIGQVDHLIGLYYDLRPPVSFPGTAGWAASPDLLRFLYDSVHDLRRSRIVECGSGVSTLIMAYALRELGQGRVVALDHEARFAAHTRAVLERHGLSDWAEVRVAALAEVTVEGERWPWYDVTTLPDGPIDMLVVDGPPKATRSQARFPAVPLLHDRLTEDAIVVLDDHERPDEQAAGRRWVELYPDLTSEALGHHKNTLVLRRGR